MIRFGQANPCLEAALALSLLSIWVEKMMIHLFSSLVPLSIVKKNSQSVLFNETPFFCFFLKEEFGTANVNFTQLTRVNKEFFPTCQPASCYKVTGLGSIISSSPGMFSVALSVHSLPATNRLEEPRIFLNRN